jgi:amino-acid N-acetyltransferase
MNVRPATPSDVPLIAALIRTHAARAEMLPRPLPAIWAALPDFVVGVWGGRVVACGSLEHYSPLEAEVRSLAVEAGARGLGCGSSVVQALVSEAQRRGTCRLFALTRAVPFFRRLGFVPANRSCFPDKIAKDCLGCARRDCCDETAVVLHLATGAGSLYCTEQHAS